MAELVVCRVGRWASRTETYAAEAAAAAAGEKKSARAEVPELTVPWRYVLPEDWPLGIAYMVGVLACNDRDDDPSLISTFQPFFNHCDLVELLINLH